MPQPPHIQWLLVNRGTALKAVLDGQGADLEVEDAIDVLVAADPSPGLHAVQWLVDTLIGGGLLWEDVAGGADSKAGETLGWFVQHRRALPRGQRNLEDHQGLASVYRAVEPLLAPGLDGDGDESTGRALRRAQRVQARVESIIIHESPELIVAVPLTRAAAQWWGRGTRWCTAAEQSNMFDYYNQHAPLIVVVMPRVGAVPDSGDSESGVHDMGKLQLWLGPHGQVQFMDAADGHVEPSFVQAHWDVLRPIMTWALACGGDITSCMPKAVLHGQVAELFLTVSRTGLDCIEGQHRTAQVCRAALGVDASSLRDVPPAVMDAGMAWMAVKSCPLMLAHVRDDLITAEMCMMAAASGLPSMDLVPREFWSPALFKVALQVNGLLLRSVPTAVRTPELARIALGQDGEVLAYLPMAERTPELCMLAVQTSGAALALVPTELWTQGMLMAAVVGDSKALRTIHDLMPEHITPPLVQACVASNPDGFRHVPQDLKTRELSMQAVQSNGQMLAWVPPRIRDAQLCEVAVAQCPDVFSIVDPELQTEIMCTKALGANPFMVRKVAPHLLSHDLCRMAVGLYSRVILYIPAECMPPGLLAETMAKHPYLLRYISRDKQTLEVCTAAVGAEARMLAYVAPGLHQQVVQAVACLPPPQPRQPSQSRPTLDIRAQWVAETALAGLRECLARDPEPGADLPGPG